METRVLGRTGLAVSVLGFGCGAVGGLMVRGNPADQERAVARAIELGINYFDTAAMYGNGESERNLGRVMKSLKPDILVGTKVRVPDGERSRIGAAVTASLEASLQRLQLDHVDLFQLHNHITADGSDGGFSPDIVLGEIVPAFERLRQQGKTRFCGITAVGDTPALHQVIDARAFDTAQVSYNLLNPSAGAAVPHGYPAHDFGNLLAHTKASEMGVINIRVLAAGALSGTEDRHPLGSPSVEPIGSGGSYRTDVERALAARAADPRRPCREPDRRGLAVRYRQRRRIDRAGRLLDARPARGRGALDQQGPAVARRTRSARGAAARVCRRAAVKGAA